MILTLTVILLGKPLAALVIVRLLKYPLRVAISMRSPAQIGEFSFILAQAGKSLGLFDDRATNTLIAAAIASISLNPILYGLVGPLESALRRFLGDSRGKIVETQSHLEVITKTPWKTGPHRVVIVGYGPVGRTLGRLLTENRIEPVVIEMNLETVRLLGTQGIQAIYGDATDRQTLEQAGARARSAWGPSVSSQMDRVAETIRLSRELNPLILIVARSNSLRNCPRSVRRGPISVFSGEGEVALSMTDCHGNWEPRPIRSIGKRMRIPSDLLGDTAEGQFPFQERAWPPKLSRFSGSKRTAYRQTRGRNWDWLAPLVTLLTDNRRAWKDRLVIKGTCYGDTLRQIHTLFNIETVGGLTDGQLLEQFTKLHRARLLNSRGALSNATVRWLVRGCRLVLREPHDAQDAFQATFLIWSTTSVRSANATRWPVDFTGSLVEQQPAPRWPTPGAGGMNEKSLRRQ